MVDHHAVCPDLNLEQFGVINHPVVQQFPVHVFPENRQTGIPSGRSHDRAGPGIFDAQGPRHGNSLLLSLKE